MKHKKPGWKRLLRASTALFMATVSLWLLLAGGGTTALRLLGGETALVTGALQAELGSAAWSSGTLSGWERLAVGQSPLLAENEAAILRALKAGRPTLPGGAGEPLQLQEPTGPDAEDDPQKLDAAPGGAGEIVPRTLVPSTAENYTSAAGVYILNRSSQSVDAAALARAPVELALSRQGPQVLIMHTHACEAYTPAGEEDTYVPSDPSRTLDTRYNVVQVGREIQAVFEEMGLTVLHDETLYDYPSYNAAYTGARAGVEQYLRDYPSIQVVLDIHRDALIGGDGTVYKAVTTIDGQSAAQIMLVMGTDDKGSHPNWEKNLALAFRLEKSMNTLYPTLARPISVRSSHYNQFLAPGALLVEVGCHGNTLQEAVTGARLFARAAGQVLVGLEEEA